MKKLLTPVHLLASSLLMGCWVDANAQSLGRAAAEAWMGRPLEMSVPARFASAAPDDECVQADVFFGDQRVPANAVRATVVGTDEQRRVRVSTTTLIDEPIVTVSLRAGCRNTVTRSYTLLPELPSEDVIAAMVRRQEVALSAPRAAPAAPAPQLRVATAVRPVPVASRVPARPRLQVEPLDLEPQAPLRATHALADPAGDASRRAAAALLWQAINAEPQELLRTSAMLQKLEGDLAQLRQGSGRSRAEIEALRRRMDEAQPWFLAPAMAQGLALLLLAAAAAAALSWHRARRAQAAAAWYQPEQPESAGPAAAADIPIEPAAVEQPAAVKVAAPRRPPSGLLRVETLAATFEEVDFLCSLGLVHDAMDVLKAYLQDSAGPSPHALVELLRLCEAVDDVSGIAAVRRRYADQFGVDAPRLQQATAAVGLESLPELSARLTRAWARREALEVIEEALFVPAPGGTVLTLQAARDLLLLHDLAFALAADGGKLPARREELAPWAEVEDAAAVQAVTKAMAGEEGGERFALDFDVGAAPAPLPQTQQPTDLAPLLAEVRRAAARDAARRSQHEEEDAFSAAVARERVPVSRF